MKKVLKPIIVLFSFLIVSNLAQSQTTYELKRQQAPLAGFQNGVSTIPVVNSFVTDANNLGSFTSGVPSISLSVSLTNQRFTNLNYGIANYNFGPGGGAVVSTVQTTGLVFGAGPTIASLTPGEAFNPQGAYPFSTYDNLGSYTNNLGKPTNPMFTSSPLASPTAASVNPSGTGIDVSAGLASKLNGGVNVFTTAQALFNDTVTNPKGSRQYFGNIVFTFSSPVLNPVLHFAGLGGSYRYYPQGISNPLPSDYRNAFFTTELELESTGYTSTLMSGNAFFKVTGNNIENSNHINPNGGSVFDNTEILNNYGAASGSVRVEGVVSQLVYRVYLQGGSGSDFAWSANRFKPDGSINISDAVREPFTGDIWYVSASFIKPTQQISGNVFIDRDGLTDNNINKSAGIANPATNLGGSLFANLLNASGQAVATTPVGINGAYLFDNVPEGIYSVQLTIFPGSGTYTSPSAPPATVLPSDPLDPLNIWANTGEFVGNTVGSDGLVNGKSSNVVVGPNDTRVEVNFGIERLPQSLTYVTFIPRPLLNSVITLNGALPVLSGSDPEDQPAPGSLNTKSLKIDILPTNATLLYAGVIVFQGQEIPNYNPALLQVKFTDPGAGLSGIVVFSYSYIDAAGLADPTPATYTIRWPDIGLLPIVLSDFTATKSNCNGMLNWKTSSELESLKFELEFSTTTNTTFETLGTIAASGNSSSTKSYQFNFSMESGVVYYVRIKMYKKDGTYTYSEIRTLSCLETKAPIAVVPNPTNTGAFQIRNMAKGKNTVSIYSNDGKLIRTENVLNNKNIVISDLASGTYVIRILNENGSASVERLVKY